MNSSDEYCFWLHRYFEALGFEFVLSNSIEGEWEYDCILINDGIEAYFSFNASNKKNPQFDAVHQVAEVMKTIILDRVNYVQYDVLCQEMVDSAIGHMWTKEEDESQ